jgi:hypothetical protein
MNGKAPLTTSRIFWFWLPLAAMWLLMAIEHPIVAAVIARLPRPEPNLAIFGVTFSLALIIESPIIMLLSAGTALARDKHSYERLLAFTHILAAGLTGLHLLIGLTPLYGAIVGDLIGVPFEILEASRRTFLLMTPWTAVIAYRRLWQGVLIRFDRTRLVPLTILTRLLTVCGVLAMGFSTRWVGGADLGAIGLSIGVTVAALTAYGFVRPTVRKHLSLVSSEEEQLTWRELIRFYTPLALTPLINLLGRPLLVMGLARAAQPMASLAVWPVIMGVLFLGRALALSYQEVVVALMDDRRSFEQLRRFTLGLGLILTGSFVLATLTPGARILYERVAGLSADLVAQAIIPTIILSAVPGLDTLVSWQHGLLIQTKRTRPITGAVILHVAMLATVMLGAGTLLPMTPGIVLAAIALTAAVAVQYGYLRGTGRDVEIRVPVAPLKEDILGAESISVLGVRSEK